jgi:hypothetical protein
MHAGSVCMPQTLKKNGTQLGFLYFFIAVGEVKEHQHKFPLPNSNISPCKKYNLQKYSLQETKIPQDLRTL